MMNELKLSLDGDVWYVDFSGTWECRNIISLFGTFRIPTAFTSESAPEQVVREIAKSYPQYTITL